MPPGGPVAPAGGDVPAYLAGAYHLRNEHCYATAAGANPARPELGREPGYAVFLAALMTIDPAFSRFTLDCLKSNQACAASLFAVPRGANLGLILASGIALFVLARSMTGEPAGGLIAAAYLLLNAHANKSWGDLMSDRLAIFLVLVCMLALAFAARACSLWRYAAIGASFAALTLTKAIFAPFCVLAWCATAIVLLSRRIFHPRLTMLVAPAAIYCVLVGGWIVRNDAVSGMARLTDQRSGIALSTRAVFDTLSPREYAASLVFWTGSAGPKFARSWFGHAIADRFDLRTPGGYYDIGQNGYARQVGAIMQTEHLPYWQAARRVDGRIIAGIRQHWLGYAASMLPLTYRGLWVDEFIWLGLPCLVLASWKAARQRDGLMLLLMGLGIFNILAYPAVSLNIERYQLTALPTLALAVANIFAGRSRADEAVVRLQQPVAQALAAMPAPTTLFHVSGRQSARA